MFFLTGFVLGCTNIMFLLGYRTGGKKRPRKTESVFRFQFIFPTEKPTNKSRFSVGKTDENPTEKNEFRFWVHNTDSG